MDARHDSFELESDVDWVFTNDGDEVITISDDDDQDRYGGN